jgi:hypothetical protein
MKKSSQTKRERRQVKFRRIFSNGSGEVRKDVDGWRGGSGCGGAGEGWREGSYRYERRKGGEGWGRGDSGEV